jgi:hypothetical protein
VVDVDATMATRLPVRLLRSVDELPLGTCLRISGLPSGASLSGGQANPGKGWIVPLWALETLKIRFPSKGIAGDLNLVVALVDNHDMVLDEQTTRLQVRAPAGPAPISSGREAAPTMTADPSVEDQKNAIAKPPSSGTTNTNTNLVDEQASTARIKSPVGSAPDSSDGHAAPTVAADPTVAHQKQAVAEPSPSRSTGTAASQAASPTTITPPNRQLTDRPFELTSSDFRADFRGAMSLIKQTGLPENHRHTTGIAVADRVSTEFVMVKDLTNGLAAHAPSANPDLQVYPTPGTGDLKAVRDVLTLPSTDFAIVSVPVMDKLRSSKTYGDIDTRLALIGPLLTEELHVLAVSPIQDIHGLAGQTISLGPRGSLAAIMGHDILTALDVKANEVNLDFDAALDGMRAGKVSALLLISGKPVRHLAESTKTSGFHLLEVPYLPAFEKDLIRTSLGHDDYPGLVPSSDVQTIGVRSALWAYRWPEQSERHGLVKLFLDRLTNHLSDLRSGAFHPKWKEADLNGSVPGWSGEFSRGNSAERGQPKL